MCERLQPCVWEAAALCVGGCSPMCRRLPPCVSPGRAEMPWHGAEAAKTLRITSMKALWMTSSSELSWS